MLILCADVQRELIRAFLQGDCEQGFVLGCTSCLDRLDHCLQIPAIQAGTYFYVPDTVAADKAIRTWGEQGVCFCGFVHSHLVNRHELSDKDREFAFQLFDVYSLPVLWFGVCVVSGDVADLFFYAITETDGEKKIASVEVQTIS